MLKSDGSLRQVIMEVVYAGVLNVFATTILMAEVSNRAIIFTINLFTLSQCAEGLLPGSSPDPGKKCRPNKSNELGWSSMLGFQDSLPSG